MTVAIHLPSNIYTLYCNVFLIVVVIIIIIIAYEALDLFWVQTLKLLQVEVF